MGLATRASNSIQLIRLYARTDIYLIDFSRTISDWNKVNIGDVTVEEFLIDLL